MKKLPISKFDLVMIIVFVVIGLLGGGAWYYLSQQLTQAQQDVTEAKSISTRPIMRVPRRF